MDSVWEHARERDRGRKRDRDGGGKSAPDKGALKAEAVLQETQQSL